MIAAIRLAIDQFAEGLLDKIFTIGHGFASLVFAEKITAIECFSAMNQAEHKERASADENDRLAGQTLYLSQSSVEAA